MKDVYLTLVFEADSLSEEERSSLVEKCSAAYWSHAIDERNALEAEVERLRAANLDSVAVCKQALQAKVMAEQERDQLKALAIQLCEAVENNDGLPPTKYALRCGSLVNQLRQQAKEDQ